MTRQELDDHLVDYLYDELSDAERRRFEEALGDHPDLQAEVAAHRDTRQTMARLGEEPMPEGLLDGVLREARAAGPQPRAALEEERPGLLDRLVALVMQPAFAAAMLFLVVGATGLFLAVQEEDRRGAPSMGEVAVHRPPAMETEPPAPEPSRAVAEPEARLAEGSGVPPEADEAAEPTAEVALAEAEPEPEAAEPAAEEPARREAATRVARADKRERSAGKKAVAKKPTPKSDDQAEQIADALDVQPGTIEGGGGANRPTGTPLGLGYEGLEQKRTARRQERGAEEKIFAPAPAPAEEAPAASPWQEVERDLDRASEPARKAKILLAAHDRFVRSGREDLADRALSTLEAIPGWEKVASSRRAADAARRARDEAAQEEAAPAEKATDEAAPAND